MFDLTPAERRGALVLLALVALGACADLLQREPVPTPEPAVVPVPGPTAPPAPAVPGAESHAPLDLNAATEADLDRLPGIGPVLAGRIVAQRERHGPFHAVEDLLAVPGIGPRLFERVRPLVIVGAPAAPAARVMQNARRSSK